MDNTQPNWLTTLSAISGLGLSIVREIRTPSPAPLPQGATGVQVGVNSGGVSVTTSPAIVVAAIAGLVVVVWLVARK